jgi:hypothetical protein
MVMPLVGAAARMAAKKLAEKGGKKMSKAQAEKLEFEEAKDTLGKTAAGAALGSAGAVAYDTYENPTKSGLGMRPEVAERKQKEREAKDEKKRETRGMKKGGMVKSSASKRADGCAQRGKTKGRMV